MEKTGFGMEKIRAPRAKKKCLGLKILHKFFDAEPYPGSGIFLTLDPG
jgi:hypothetical protein